MWKNIIKLQKFYPHEYWFSNIIAFSSLRSSRGSMHTTSETFLNWRYWVNYIQLLWIILPKSVRTGWGFNLSPAVWGFNLSPNQLFVWFWKYNFFLDIFFSQTFFIYLFNEDLSIEQVFCIIRAVRSDPVDYLRFSAFGKEKTLKFSGRLRRPDGCETRVFSPKGFSPVSYTHLRAPET